MLAPFATFIATSGLHITLLGSIALFPGLSIFLFIGLHSDGTIHCRDETYSISKDMRFSELKYKLFFSPSSYMQRAQQYLVIPFLDIGYKIITMHVNKPTSK